MTMWPQAFLIRLSTVAPVLFLLCAPALAQRDDFSGESQASRLYVAAGAGNHALPLLAAGWTMNRYASIEAGYTDFGKLKDVQTSATTLDVWSVRGYGLNAIGSLPLRGFVVQANVGLYWMRGTRTTSELNAAERIWVDIAQERERKTVAAYGVAASYDLSKWLAFRLAAERLGSPMAGVDTINSVTLASVARF